MTGTTPLQLVPPPSCRPIGMLLVVLLLVGFTPAAAQTPSTCADVLTAAEAAYLEGNFAATVRLLTPCLAEDTLAKKDAVAAYRLLSMAQMNQGDAYGARQAVTKLLTLSPGYKPDPVQDVPSYTVLVLIIKDQLRQDGGMDGACEEALRPVPWTKKRETWLVAGGGLLVVGLTAIFAGG